MLTTTSSSTCSSSSGTYTVSETTHPEYHLRGCEYLLSTYLVPTSVPPFAPVAHQMHTMYVLVVEHHSSHTVHQTPMLHTMNTTSI